MLQELSREPSVSSGWQGHRWIERLALHPVKSIRLAHQIGKGSKRAKYSAADDKFQIVEKLNSPILNIKTSLINNIAYTNIKKWCLSTVIENDIEISIIVS